MTQHELIITLGESRGKYGFFCWELTRQGVPQYNARISEIRDFYGCTCKHGANDHCKGTHHIISEYLPEFKQYRFRLLKDPFWKTIFSRKN